MPPLSALSITYLAGIALIFISLIGGGLEIKEIRIPPIGTIPRVISFISGIILFFLGFIVSNWPPATTTATAGSPTLTQNQNQSAPKPSMSSDTGASFVVQLAAFREDEDATNKALSIFGKVSKCGSFAQFVISKKKFPNLTDGYLVSALGPYSTEAEALAVRDKVLSCVPDAIPRRITNTSQ